MNRNKNTPVKVYCVHRQCCCVNVVLCVETIRLDLRKKYRAQIHSLAPYILCMCVFECLSHILYIACMCVIWCGQVQDGTLSRARNKQERKNACVNACALPL